MSSEDFENAFSQEFEELIQRAYKDSLSGLLNRATMELYIKERLSNMSDDERCALFIIDLDDFKQVNDSLGHLAGDKAIKESASILKRLFKANDIVGRLGGDEFAVFISGYIKENDVKKKAEEILNSLQLAIKNEHNTITLTASVGIYYSDFKVSFEGMYQSADLALYKAKKAGKHAYSMKANNRYRGKFNDVNTKINAIPMKRLLEFLDSGIALLDIDKNGLLSYLSPSFYRIIGKDEKGQKKSLKDIICEPDYPMLKRRLEEAFRDQEEINEVVRGIKSNGDLSWWQIKAVPFSYSEDSRTVMLSINDISEFKEKEDRLKEINDRLLFAFEQTERRLWEVDIPKSKLFIYEKGKIRAEKSKEYSFPNGIIDNGYIHPISLLRFKEFAEKLMHGSDQGYGNFIIRSENGGYRWKTLSYKIMYSNNGKADRAIGISESLNDKIAENSSPIIQPSLLPELLISDLLVSLSIDLDNKTLIDFWRCGESLSRDDLRGKNPESVLSYQSDKIFYEKDRKRLKPFFNMENLKKLYEEDGRKWIFASYQRTEEDGTIHAVRHIINLTKADNSNNLCMLSYIIKVNLPRYLDSITVLNMDKNNNTGLYDRSSIFELLKIIEKEGAEKSAIVIFQIKGLDNSNYEKREKLYSAVSAPLILSLGGSSIIGKYDNDKILILFPEYSSKNNIKKVLEDTFSFIRRTERDSNSLNFIAAITSKNMASSSFASDIENAINVVLSTNLPTDTAIFAEGLRENSVATLQSNDSPDKYIDISIKKVLCQKEKDISFDIMASMLSSDSLKKSLLSVLEKICSYYNADRTYILHLIENDHILTMPYEWDSLGKNSIQNVVSGMLVERFPIFVKCMKRKEPILLKRDKGNNSQAWSFIAYPLKNGITVTGFLAIENPKENEDSISFISTLIPYILREEIRFAEQTSKEMSSEKLMGIPDLRSYTKRIYSLSSNNYSTLGALCIDIPRMAAINGSLGFEYGTKLLLFVSKALLDIFGKSFVFRTWEAEFVAFLPNTTKQVFIARANRLSLMIQREYPNEVRIGTSWAENDFIGPHIVEEAREDLRRKHLRSTDQFLINSLKNESYSVLKDSAKAEDFVVFYQPKIDMMTSEIVGCEALVRAVDKHNRIILPSEFIANFEKNGGIREMDLIVFEKVLQNASEWQKKGFKVLPTSINLSRITLLYPSTLASIWALESRFPNLDESLFEFEITENSEVFEKDELKAIVEHFRSNNIRIALDDFGSEYANLSVFTNINFDTIKLDKSLIRDLTDNPINRMLLSDIIKICNVRGMACIAEGVETKEQRDALINAGCHIAQGYLYDRPLSAFEFESKYLKKERKDGK